MSKSYPPYMNATGMISKILDKIKVAATPERFTQDYLSTELGFSGGSAKAFIPLAKKLGLIGSDGSPTELYKQFRNTNTNVSKHAIGKAMKNAFSDIYNRNEYAHSLSKADLEGLIMEITGMEKGNAVVRAIVGTFEQLKGYADFKQKESEVHATATTPEPSPLTKATDDIEQINLGLSYTINLVLPKTDDVAVFNAIFKSLRENLLRK